MPDEECPEADNQPNSKGVRRVMKPLISLAACVLAMLPIACGGNQLIHAPAAPEQKTTFHEEDARKYDIRDLNAKVADDQTTLYEAQRNMSLDLACVAEENWDVKNAEDPNPAYVIKGASLNPQEARGVEATFDYFNKSFRKLEYEYARFQDFRRLYDGAQHDQRLLRVAIQQGLATMYAGRRILEFASAFEAEHCSLKPLKKGLKATEAIVADVGQGQLQAMMHVFDPTDRWGKLLLDVQIASVSGGDAITPCTTGVKDLANSATGYDTSILSWCGYAAARAGQSEQAKQYWTQAGRSVHDPEGAAYALARLRDAGEAPAFGKVKVTRLKVD
jgi:hypothetical protein